MLAAVCQPKAMWCSISVHRSPCNWAARSRSLGPPHLPSWTSTCLSLFQLKKIHDACCIIAQHRRNIIIILCDLPARLSGKRTCSDELMPLEAVHVWVPMYFLSYDMTLRHSKRGAGRADMFHMRKASKPSCSYLWRWRALSSFHSRNRYQHLH